jgi:hypothetical protein
MAECQALHLLAVPCAGQQNLWRQGVILTHTEIVQSGSRTVAVGSNNLRARSDTALGAFYRRLSSRAGKSKAVTATASKIAFFFYNTLRYGMSYRDPGAEHYEQQHRSRVLANLQRRARSPGFMCRPFPAMPIRLFLRKSIAIFAGVAK